MYTVLNGSTPTPLIWVEERHSIFPFPMSWNIIQHPTRVPDRHGDQANILDLFFTSNTQHYTYAFLPSLGSSDQFLVNVSCSFAYPPPLPPAQRRLISLIAPSTLS